MPSKKYSSRPKPGITKDTSELEKLFINISDEAVEQDHFFTEDYEGQLSVDVYETEDSIIVISAIAGVEADAIDISVNNDVLTIRGHRQHEKVVEQDHQYYFQECYWGGFSRSIILPTEVQADKVEATMKNGILKIVLPKSNKSKTVKVKVK